MTDNITDLISVLEPMEGYYGAYSSIITLLIIIFIALIVGIAIFIFTHSYLLVIIAGWITLYIGASMGFIPFFIPVFYVLISIILISYSIFNYKPSDLPEAPSEQFDYWEAYGNRLKEAYSAKFGGENKGFNDEVNNRIVIMQKLKHGFTNTIAYDWLKRMKKFTEAK
jgi:hypothetical protein